MRPPTQDDPIDAFTLELLRAGSVLSGLACDVAEGMPPDAYPGEDPAQVTIEMISGTIQTFLVEQEEQVVRRATELIGGAVARVIEHLQLALALRRRMEGEGKDGRLYDEPGRAHGRQDTDDDPIPAQVVLPPRPAGPRDPLDELATELLECGAVLSQMIGHMVQFEASGRSGPNAAPIPQIAHGLVRDVIAGVRKSHSKRDVSVATKIVREAADAIVSDIYLVDPDYLDAEMN